MLENSDKKKLHEQEKDNKDKGISIMLKPLKVGIGFTNLYYNMY